MWVDRVGDELDVSERHEVLWAGEFWAGGDSRILNTDRVDL